MYQQQRGFGPELKRVHHIRPMHELRITTGAESVKICLPASSVSTEFPAAGTAEICGCELAPHKQYLVEARQQCAVFSWGGCTLQVEGFAEQERETPNNVMKEVVDASALLNARRSLALSSLRKSMGPRVLVVGPPATGKSTFCHILTAYAARKGWCPTHVELDPRGTYDRDYARLPAAAIGAVTPRIEGFEDAGESSPAAICYHFGHVDVDDDRDLFLNLCRVLAMAVNCKLVNRMKSGSERRPVVSASGLIVNAPPSPSALLLDEIVKIFLIDVMIVVEDSRLHRLLADRNSEAHQAELIFLPKMEGFAFNPARVLASVNASTRKYFAAEGVRSLRVRATDHPLGVLTSADGGLKVAPYRGSWTELGGRQLAVPCSSEEASMAWSGVSFFVFVSSVESTVDDECWVTLTVPQGGSLPVGKLLLVGTNQVLLVTE